MNTIPQSLLDEVKDYVPNSNKNPEEMAIL